MSIRNMINQVSTNTVTNLETDIRLLDLLCSFVEAQTVEAKQLVSEIHKVKENLKKENEEMKDIKQQIKDVQEKIRSQKEVGKV